MNWYKQKWEDVLSDFGVNEHGLSEDKVKNLREKFGYNRLSEAKRDSILTIFLRQFQSPVIYMLLISATIVFLMGDTVDGLIIFGVLLTNSIVGAIQEGRAQDTLFALKKMVTTHVTVLRDDKEKVLLAEELVPGDIIILTEGNKIPADARLIYSNGFKVDESAMTGESEPIVKNSETIVSEEVALGDKVNMVWNGTYVVEGEARAVVVATGINTVIGGISTKLVGIDAEMPLKKSIGTLSKVIIAIVIFVSLLVFVSGVLKGFSVSEMFLTAVAISVAAIPEGLPVVVTIILATGMHRMSKRNALVRKLQAVEALGQAEVIAVDKTGTITLNQMMVKNVYVSENFYEISGNGYEPKGEVFHNGDIISPLDHSDLIFLSKVASLSSTGTVAFYEDEKMWNRVSGDPTEVAISVFAQKIGFDKNDLEREHRKIVEMPFNSHLKYHASSHALGDKKMISVSGAPEVIMSKSSCIWKDGKEVSLNEDELKKIHEAMSSLTKDGLRVIAFASKIDSSQDGILDELSNLCFVGFVGISDSIREEVADVVASAKEAGVKVVMITGDHVETAKAIGKKTGIFKEGDMVLTSQDLSKTSEEELLKNLPKVSIFARVSPEDKLKIIELYRKSNIVIAMTGDGVNDALSLAAADLGVAMGKIGTEVAKEASDIVLQDDNMGSIVSAIEEGRNIYITIKKVILYLFSTSFGEVFTIIAAILLGYPIPILASQIIWLNFVTDGFLVAALSMEPKEKGLLMADRKKTANLIDGLIMQRIVIMGSVMMIGSLFLFDMYLPQGFLKASTVALTVLAAFQWLNIFNSRSERKTIFSKDILSNPFIWGALCIVVSLQLLAVYWPPLQSILHTTNLDINDWWVIIMVSLSIVIVEEFRKILVRVFSKNKISFKIKEIKQTV